MQAQKPALYWRAQEAVSIVGKDYNNSYSTAHENLEATLAYCGFYSYRDAFRYILNPWFLHSLVNFMVIMQGQGPKPKFQAIMTHINAYRDGEVMLRFPEDFDLYLKRFEHTIHGPKRKASPPKVELAAQALACFIYFVVHDGSDFIEDPDEQVEEYLKALRNMAKRKLGPTPAIDLSEQIFLPCSDSGEAFKQHNDKSDAERYHRVFQLMLMIRHEVSKVRIKQKQTRGRPARTTSQRKWEAFWQKPILFSNEVIDPEKYAPHWMQD